MNLENRLCKRIQPQRTIYFKILFIRNVQNSQIFRDEKSVRVYLGGCLPSGGVGEGRGGWGVTPKEKEFLLRIMKMFQNWLWWWMHNSEYTKASELYTLNGWTACYINCIWANLFFKNRLKWGRKAGPQEGRSSSAPSSNFTGSAGVQEHRSEQSRMRHVGSPTGPAAASWGPQTLTNTNFLSFLFSLSFLPAKLELNFLG